MKKLAFYALALLTLSCLPNMLHAQMPGGAPGGQRGGMPKMGKFYGKVVDSKSGRPVDAASVVLLQKQGAKEVLVKGGLTAANGEFSLEELPMMGQFQLAISAVGYKAYKQAVAFDVAALMKAGASMQRGSSGGEGMTIPEGAAGLLNIINKDLGNIRLEPTAEQLAGVTVTAQALQFTMQGEKKVFNVDQNTISKGGTAQDVMKNVPGVLVDPDGKVSIRNSPPQVLVDGRQTPLQLDQIPADAIESVEVITNPSAKFDAEGGTGGVLNVVLKKNKKKGYNGNLRAGADSRGGANLGGDFNFRSGKFNVSLNTNGNLMRNQMWSTTERTDFSQQPNLSTAQDQYTLTKGGFAFGRLGIDFFMTNRTTLSLGGMKVHGEFRPDDRIDIMTDTLLGPGTLSGYSRRTTTGKNQFDRNGVQFGIKHIFPKAGQEWTFDASYNGGSNKNDNRYTTSYFTDGSGTATTGQQSLRAAGSGSNTFTTLQSDFTLPLANSSKLDAGVKATLRAVTSDINNYYLPGNGGDYILIPNKYSNYRNTDQVYAAYATYNGNFSANTSYNIGLRVESSRYEGELTSIDSTFSNRYPASLFPSVFFSHKMKKDQQLQFNYRRGINRPNFFQLLPFTDYTDPLNIRQGNPGLRPEFTNSVELTYMKNFSRTNYVMASGYYRHSDNLITQYQRIAINPFTNGEAIISSYINASSSDRYGIELTSGWDLTKWWNVLANANIYNATLNNGLPGSTTSDNSYLSGFGKLNNNFKLPRKLTLQVSGTYQSRTNLLPESKNDGPGGRGGGGFMMTSSSSAQGYLEANWSVDAALRWSFLKGDAGSLSLSVNDIFATRRFVQHTENAYFVQDYSRLINPYMFRLNFSYRFGKVDTDLFRRKNIKGQMEGLQDAAQMM